MAHDYQSFWYFSWLRWVGGLLFGLLVYCQAGAQCLPAAGCQPGGAPTNSLNLGFGILRLRLANVDTTTDGATDGYQDYSCRRAILLNRGTTYTLRVTTGPKADEQVRAWADFNQDGVFDPLSELIFSSVGRQHVGEFTVPPTLTPGRILRLRIAADYVNSPVPGPCTTPQYSQTEDYRVVVTTVPLPQPAARFAAADSVTCSGTIVLRDRSRNAPTSWRWDFGDGTTSTQQHPSHHYAPGSYAVRLRVCNASGCDSLTKPAYITMRGNSPKPIACQPATRAYCCDFGVARVQLAELDHRPGGGAAGYQDASCAHRATLRADWPDTLHITTGGQAAHDVRVYLDLNNDGQFNPTGELLYQGLSVSSPNIVLRLNSLSPGLVYNQPLRLRICADYAGSPAVGPCVAPEWGQVADYAVQVLPNTRVPHAAFALTYNQVCGPVKVAVTNASLGSASYRWDFGDGTTSSAATPPVHTYTTPGVYTLRLLAYSPTQIDSTQREVAVAAACPAYCTAGGWGGNEDSPLHFTRVKVADVDNKEYRAPRVGYRDFTRYVATVRQGQTVSVLTESLPFSSGGLGPWTQSVVWIDYNQDGQFGPSEQAGHYTGYSPQGGSFQVPHNARLGATRVRLVIYLAADLYASNGCSPEGTTAAIEDYSVVVLPEQVAPRSGFTADLTTSCSGQVQFRDTTWSTPTNWRWDFGDGTSSTVANPLHTYATAGQYPVSLQTRNTYGTSTISRSGYVTVTGIGQGPRSSAVALSTGQLCCTNGIAQAQLATLTYQGGENQPGYRDETCRQSALHLAAGSSYPIAVRRTDRFAYHFVYLWLDANDDGVFDPSEKLFVSTSTSNIPLKEGTFTIPTTALRNRPLRLRLFWHGLRGDDYKTVWPVPDPQTRDEDYDQVRDFTVWVADAVLATAPAAASTGWVVYPNPTAGLLTLAGADAGHGVDLINSLGQFVGHFTARPATGGTFQIELKALPPGLYIVQLPGLAGARRITIE
ncbi:hypothetical protein GCM10027422_34500 [Hymenobacter arcticus]